MRIYFFILLCLILGSLVGDYAFAFSKDTIEIDLIDNNIRLTDFIIGNYKVNGSFAFTLNRDNSSLIVDLEGRDIFLIPLSSKDLTQYGPISFPWLKATLSKRGDIIFIDRFSLPQLNISGNINLRDRELTLNANGQWQEELGPLEGDIKINLGVWGKIGSFFTSGYIVAENGKYKGRPFSKFRLDFLGNPPVFNITDSEIIALDGSVFEVEGVLDLRNFSNLIPGAKFTAQKVFIDQWQLFSDRNSDIGLKKELDGKFGVSINTEDRGDATTTTETELRYNLKDDQFLKFEIEEDKSVLKLEKRRDF